MKRGKTDFQLEVIFKVRELRMNQEISQAALGDILDLRSAGSIGDIESTKRKNKYTLNELRKIAEYFEYPMYKFFLKNDELEKSKEEILNLLILKICEYDR